MTIQITVLLAMSSVIGFCTLLVIDFPQIHDPGVARWIVKVIGTLCLVFSYWLAILQPEPALGLPTGLMLPGWLILLLGLVLLIYSTSIEIPIKLAREVESPPTSLTFSLRHTVTTGTYALCRHPGFWWLFLLVAGSVLVSDQLSMLVLTGLWVILGSSAKVGRSLQPQQFQI